MEATVTITGNVGSEIQLRRSEEFSYLNFRVATTPRIRRQGNWVDGETTWIGVYCARALAEHVSASVAKGDPVVVMGRLRTYRWKGPQDEENERIYIDAIAVGHDLNRGTAVFHKTLRQAPPETGFDLGEALREAEATQDDAVASAA